MLTQFFKKNYEKKKKSKLLPRILPKLVNYVSLILYAILYIYFNVTAIPRPKYNENNRNHRTNFFSDVFVLFFYTSMIFFFTHYFTSCCFFSVPSVNIWKTVIMDIAGRLTKKKKKTVGRKQPVYQFKKKKRSVPRNNVQFINGLLPMYRVIYRVNSERVIYGLYQIIYRLPYVFFLGVREF